MKYKCFVTGGAGLIGLGVCKELIKNGHEVYLYDLGEQILRNKSKIPKQVKILIGSILDKYTLTSSIKGCDYVFHFAAMLGVKYTEDNKLSCLEVNCTGTKNVLEASALNKVKKIIFASSSEVYGEPDSNPISENNSTKGKTIYGISKIIGEEYCKAYKQKYNLNYTILRFFNTYGPNQDNKFVITKFIYAAVNNKPLVINGNGNQKRSYTYVQDSARATVIVAFNKKTNQKTYNVGNGTEPVTLKELADKISKKFKKKIKIKYKRNFNGADRTKDREIFMRYCDSSKIRKAINWKPLVKIDEGISRIIKFFKNV